MNESAGTSVESLVRSACAVRPLTQLVDALVGGEPHGTLLGLAGSAGVAWALALARRTNRPVLYVVPDTDRVERAVEDAEFLESLFGQTASDQPSYSEPAAAVACPLAVTEDNPYAEVSPDRRSAMARLGTLSRLARGDGPRLVVARAGALLRRFIPPQILRESTLLVQLNQELALEAFVSRLSEFGYLRVPMVDDPGTFAVRGGILDVFPPDRHYPFRIELSGDTVTRLRRFDPLDQRTFEDQKELLVIPAREGITSNDLAARARQRMLELCDQHEWPSSRSRPLVDDVATGRAFLGSDSYLPAFFELVPVTDYLPKDAWVVLEDPAELLSALNKEHERLSVGAQGPEVRPHFAPGTLLLEPEELAAQLAGFRTAGLAPLLQVGQGQGPFAFVESAQSDVPSLGAELPLQPGARGPSRLDQFFERLKAWQSMNWRVQVVARTRTKADHTQALLANRGMSVEPQGGRDGAPNLSIVVGSLARGAVLPAEGLVLVTEEELFGSRSHRAAPRPKRARVPVEDLKSLAVGDHVIHADHGIGRYQGIHRQSLHGFSQEFLSLEYEGGRLLLPIYRLDQIERYSGAEAHPKLDRLGGLTFAKTKARVQRRIRHLADDLLRLYSERMAATKQPLVPRDPDYAAFVAAFPFEETPDQAAAIEEVMTDLESDKAMDRLVCGDVGFGKTEVALRAAFRVAMAGRQVALLCPTTVLALQHQQTFEARLSGFGLEVRSLSRFTKPAEVTEILRRLREGSVDVVVGTHRLLSKDVQFKKLGLLVVDEEQRFGVTHKERIKQLRAQIDVLTLTATPIPRTLQMAVGGLRDLSQIATPPVDRRAIRTTVAHFDPSLVVEAVTRELSRGGQIFYVYPKIQGLEERVAWLSQRIPKARVAMAHGQMPEDRLEKTMTRFVRGDYDILVCTTLIESGLDIPRANTLLVEQAQHFGLSQLYQLRGRVGRSKERAYCYLFVPSLSELSAEARTRLQTLERFTELGSGFRVALMDLELRGAGEFLGAEQSGWASSIGFELFCHMLEDAARELRGEPIRREVEPDLSFDVDFLIPETYVEDIGVRLSLYKQLSSAQSAEEVEQIAQGLEDRFGPPPIEARQLVFMMRLRTQLRHLSILGCDARKNQVSMVFRDDTPLQAERIATLVSDPRRGYRLSPDGRLQRRCRDEETFQNGLEFADRVLYELEELVGDR